jgi:hypothetical protein
MTLAAWKKLRRQQAMRVANASRAKRAAELERYEQVDGVVARLEAEAIVLEGAA